MVLPKKDKSSTVVRRLYLSKQQGLGVFCIFFFFYHFEIVTQVDKQNLSATLKLFHMPHPYHNFLLPYKSNLCPDSDDNHVLALLNSFTAQPFTSRHSVNLVHFSCPLLPTFQNHLAHFSKSYVFSVSFIKFPLYPFLFLILCVLKNLTLWFVDFPSAQVFLIVGLWCILTVFSANWQLDVRTQSNSCLIPLAGCLGFTFFH